MVDKDVDDIVDKTIELIKKEDNYYNAGRLWVEKIDVIYRLLNRKRYMELLINGKITNSQRKIHDLIEEYKLTDNKKFMIKLIKLECSLASEVLEYVSEELRNDKEVVLEAVKQDGLALELASEELKNDKDVVLEAVRENRYALEFASEELKRLYEELLPSF